MFSELKSVGLFGIDSYMIEVEADISSGLPAFDIVGLPVLGLGIARQGAAALKTVALNSHRADNHKSCSGGSEGSIYDCRCL
ncbi:MAG: hypothetical protein ACLR56_07590 [Oscillospiraceae bacterium]